MKVKELIEMLKGFDPENVVLLPKNIGKGLECDNFTEIGKIEELFWNGQEINSPDDDQEVLMNCEMACCLWT